VAYLECRLTQRIPAGDHEIVVGRPVAGEILRPDAIALSYADTGELDGSRELYPESFDWIRALDGQAASLSVWLLVSAAWLGPAKLGALMA
jgi:flavin reductase (DIM6/NTAB) family NADH-FMN oxidoreductase RutF